MSVPFRKMLTIDTIVTIFDISKLIYYFCREGQCFGYKLLSHPIENLEQKTFM